MAEHYQDGVSARNMALNDASSPFFLNSNENPGAILVSQVFDGSCFSQWKRAMVIALSAKNKLCFVDGSCPRPSPNSTILQQWIRCNDMVISWILNSLKKEISASVLYSDKASTIWTELEQRYGQFNNAQLYEIRKELSQITQASSSVASYYTRIKGLWDEIQTLRVITPCSCESFQAFLKLEEEDKLMQFLMGLNEQFTTIRGNILMMKPLPTIAQAYSLLIQDEKQREICSNSQLVIDSVSMNAGNGGNSFRGNSSQRGRGRGEYRRNNIFCDYCKRAGHLKEKCYKLHGFPAGNRNQVKRIAANVQNEESDIKMSHDLESVSLIPELNKAQYAKLMQFLNASKEGELTGSANFAGPFSEDAIGSW